MIAFKIEHSMCKMGEPTSLGLMVELTAPKAAPQLAGPDGNIPNQAKAIIFVVDRSGSMSGNRLELVKQTILETLPRLHRDDYLSVVTFDDTAYVDVPIRAIRLHDMSRVASVVGKLGPGGNTNLEAGYRAAIDQASNLPKGTPVNLILLSDGHANSGLVNPAMLGRIAAQAAEQSITTSTIGIGDGYDEKILDALADQGQGNHTAALELGEALAGLQAEIDNLLQKTMLNVEIEIKFGPSFAGRRADIKAARRMRRWDYNRTSVRGVLGDLSSEEQKSVLFDLTLDAHELAQPGWERGFLVRVSYTDANTGDVVREEQVFDIDLVEPHRWMEPVRDPNIVGELMLARLQDVSKKALRLFEAGREDEADALLKQAADNLDRYIAEAKLDPTTAERLRAQIIDFQSFAFMGTVNEKRKRLYESNNRMARNRRNFRDDNFTS
jgi:Ca-activated chloride channel family protein